MVVLRRVLMVVMVAGLCFGTTLTAAAQTSPDEQLDECLGDGFHPNGPPSCSFDSEGNLTDRDFPGQAPISAGSGMAGWVAFAFLWSAVPMVIGGAVASSRGQSVGVALLLTFFFGWLGLAFVVLAQKPETAQAVRSVVTRLSEPEPDVADQIRKLGELRREGLLTDEEFQRKKTQLLGAS